MIQHLNVAGETNTWHYDERNRVDNSSWSSGAAPTTETHYDPASRVNSVVTKEGGNTITAVTFNYDNANRLLWEDQTVTGSTHRVQHDRDSDGNPIDTYIPGWYLNWFHYNQRNQMDQIQDGGGTPWFNFSYDAAGNMIKRQAVYGGVNDSLNVPSQYYDALNRPTMWENTGSGDNAFARSWQQYDTV